MNDGIEKRNAVKNGISRLIFSMLVFLLEAFFIINSFLSLNEYVIWIDRATRVFAVLLVLVIYAMNKTSSMKTPWIILILVFKRKMRKGVLGNCSGIKKAACFPCGP